MSVSVTVIMLPPTHPQVLCTHVILLGVDDFRRYDGDAAEEL